MVDARLTEAYKQGCRARPDVHVTDGMHLVGSLSNHNLENSFPSCLVKYTVEIKQGTVLKRHAHIAT
jgi:hypothetical protein